MLNHDPQILRYTVDVAMKSVEAAREFVRAYPDFDDVGFGRWACVFKETQEVIGFCGFKYLADLDVVDVGYRFLPDFWGLGLATEACQACLEFGFETMGLSRVFAFVMPENQASMRVLEKCGLRFDAVFDYDGIATHRYVIACDASSASD